eukprot:scaffold100881_cov28-Tisochrysis_lutea.AAC.2
MNPIVNLVSRAFMCALRTCVYARVGPTERLNSPVSCVGASWAMCGLMQDVRARAPVLWLWLSA